MPGSTVRSADEAADHEARGDQQHERERDLRDDERVARAVTSRGPRCSERAAPRSASTTRGAAYFAIGSKHNSAPHSSETPSANTRDVGVDADVERARQRAAGEP